MTTPEDSTLIHTGEAFQIELRYTREQIAQFARLTGDTNPLHHDPQAAQRASFGEIIASGQQTAGHMMGVVATHYSRRDADVQRAVLCLNFNFAFRAPVFAEQDIVIAWRVREIERSTTRGGFIGHLDGNASIAGKACVVGRGTVWVSRAASQPV